MGSHHVGSGDDGGDDVAGDGAGDGAGGAVAFPFFVGSARSGTTLLRAMFDSHPDMAIPWESYFIVSMEPNRRRYEGEGSFAAERFVADLGSTGFSRWDLPEDEVRDALADGGPNTYAEAIRIVYACYARSRGKPRYGDKTPRYVLDIPLLAELFPEAKFVHIIRDGRDVAVSLLDVEWGTNDVAEAALWWMTSVSRGRAAGSVLGPARYAEVRYEQLVDDAEATLRPVCRFLGLAWDPAMLAYSSRADELAAPDPFPTHHRRLSLPPTSGLRDWRRDMSREQVERFEDVAGPTLAETGYEVVSTSA